VTRPLHRALLLAVETDRSARLADGVWQTRCIHCRTRLTVGEDGRPLGSTTLEHVVPRSWFGLREAAALTAYLTGPDDPRNLALACARCNQAKGRGPDARGPGDPDALALVGQLQATRLARLRDPQAP
jgi:hypothetical protein